MPWLRTRAIGARSLADRRPLGYSRSSMRHVRLGRTGLPVSRLCLGTMTFGLQCDEPTSVAILERAAAGGITFLDTSDVCPLGGSLETVGRTEEILGGWLGPRRRDFVIATKCFDPDLKARLDELTREYRGGDDPR